MKIYIKSERKRRTFLNRKAIKGEGEGERAAEIHMKRGKDKGEIRFTQRVRQKGNMVL